MQAVGSKHRACGLTTRRLVCLYLDEAATCIRATADHSQLGAKAAIWQEASLAYKSVGCQRWVMKPSSATSLPGPSGRLLNHGYLILHLEGLSIGTGWEGPLPPMAQLTTQVLAHDIEDGYRLGNRTLGCPLPLETKAHGWGKSFRYTERVKQLVHTGCHTVLKWRLLLEWV